MFVSMTRARRTAKGLVTPPPLHHWMEAVLLLCVSLVQGAVSTLKMIFNRKTRDWHADHAREALPQATSSNQFQDHLSQPSFSDKRNARIPRIPVASSRGTTMYSPAAYNRNARHKAAHDSVSVAQCTPLSPVIPAEARQREELEPRSDTLALSPLMPTHVGIQGRPRPLSRLAASRQRTHHNRSGIPASAGMSGALRGKLRAKYA